MVRGKFVDITGQRYGRLIVKKRAPNNKWGRSQWICLCDCGNQINAAGNDLQTKHTQSCGCLHRDNHRRYKIPTTFNGKKIKEYSAFHSMMGRCYNKNNTRYKDYGGRGITVCDRWRDKKTGYDNFIADMGMKPTPKHSLDRIDVNGNYEPGNCRWATDKEQRANKRPYPKNRKSRKTKTRPQINI